MTLPVSPENSPTEVPTCEFVVHWGNRWNMVFQCGTKATKRYPAAGGGFMYLCDEHSIKHLDYAEDVPRDR